VGGYNVGDAAESSILLEHQAQPLELGSVRPEVIEEGLVARVFPA